MDSTRVDISVVVPVYNSAETLQELHSRISTVLSNSSKQYELVLVNDGSRDESWRRLQEIADQDSRVVAIDLARNFGQNNALMCGFQHCRGELVVTMDDDLQHPPEEINTLLQAIESGDDDVVIGRYRTKKHSLFRNAGSQLTHRISQVILRVPKDLALTSFRVMRRWVVDELLRFKTHNPRVGLMLFSVTTRQVNVDVDHHSRPRGRSTYTVRSLVRNFMDELVNYSALPLRIASYFGFLSAFVSFSLGVFYTVRFLMGLTGVSGFTTIVLLISFVCGLLLMTMGIVGEYLIRIVRAAEYRPQFVVRQLRASDDAGPADLQTTDTSG